VVSTLTAWLVPSVLVINLALAAFALTEPGEICHDLPCREGAGTDRLDRGRRTGLHRRRAAVHRRAVRVCRRLPAGAIRRRGWTVLTLLTAASVALYASRW
jgi:hypothetical protein